MGVGDVEIGGRGGSVVVAAGAAAVRGFGHCAWLARIIDRRKALLPSVVKHLGCLGGLVPPRTATGLAHTPTRVNRCQRTERQTTFQYAFKRTQRDITRSPMSYTAPLLGPTQGLVAQRQREASAPLLTIPTKRRTRHGLPNLHSFDRCRRGHWAQTLVHGRGPFSSPLSYSYRHP